MTPAEARAIAGQVKANAARLDECRQHDFVATAKDVLTTQYQCTHCLGQITGFAYRWYMRGRAHGAAG
jgi:hypothetical protein